MARWRKIWPFFSFFIIFVFFWLLNAASSLDILRSKQSPYPAFRISMPFMHLTSHFSLRKRSVFSLFSLFSLYLSSSVVSYGVQSQSIYIFIFIFILFAFNLPRLSLYAMICHAVLYLKKGGLLFIVLHCPLLYSFRRSWP